MSSFSMRSIDFTFYFVRFEGCFDMNVAIDNHETHFQLSTLVSFAAINQLVGGLVCVVLCYLSTGYR